MILLNTKVLLLTIVIVLSSIQCIEDSNSQQSILGENSIEDEVPHFIPPYIESEETIYVNETADIPNDISTVSKFIQEFHKKMEGDISVGGKMLASTAEDQVSVTIFSMIDDNEETPITQLLPYYPLRHIEIPINSTNKTTNITTPLVNCDLNLKYTGSAVVEVVNSTRFIQLLKSNVNITMRSEPAGCLVALFYARTCPFSAMAAPHYNALPRAYPNMKMVALNAMKHQIFNTQFGIVGVPTVLLFHNGRPAAKFNYSEYTLEQFARFIQTYTGWKPEQKMFVTSADFGGPVPSAPIKETDRWLLVAWFVVNFCTLYGFTKTRYWHCLIESIKNTWREAEAAEVRHEHAD